MRNNPLRYVDPTGMYAMDTGTVEDGDTLSSITSELNDYFGTSMSYDDVAKINSISDPDSLQVGQIVKMGTVNADGKSLKIV